MVSAAADTGRRDTEPAPDGVAVAGQMV